MPGQGRCKLCGRASVAAGEPCFDDSECTGRRTGCYQSEGDVAGDAVEPQRFFDEISKASTNDEGRSPRHHAPGYGAIVPEVLQSFREARRFASSRRLGQRPKHGSDGILKERRLTRIMIVEGGASHAGGCRDRVRRDRAVAMFDKQAVERVAQRSPGALYARIMLVPLGRSHAYRRSTHLPDKPLPKSDTCGTKPATSGDSKGTEMTKTLSTERTAAVLIFIPALLSFVMVLHHPVLRLGDTQGSAALATGIGRIASETRIFHGLILVLVAVQALGLYRFAERLGLSRLWVRAGILFYGLSTVLMFVPGTIDGLVTPLLGSRCFGDAPQCANSLAGSLTFAWAAIQAFTTIALALQALGLLSWSVALALSSGWQRWAGICGGLLAIAPLAMLGTLDRAIDPLVLAEIIIFEAIWAMAAAIMLWSDRIRADRAI